MVQLNSSFSKLEPKKGKVDHGLSDEFWGFQKKDCAFLPAWGPAGGVAIISNLNECLEFLGDNFF